MCVYVHVCMGGGGVGGEPLLSLISPQASIDPSICQGLLIDLPNMIAVKLCAIKHRLICVRLCSWPIQKIIIDYLRIQTNIDLFVRPISDRKSSSGGVFLTISD